MKQNNPEMHFIFSIHYDYTKFDYLELKKPCHRKKKTKKKVCVKTDLITCFAKPPPSVCTAADMLSVVC